MGLAEVTPQTFLSGHLLLPDDLVDELRQGQRSHGYLHQKKDHFDLSIQALLLAGLVEQYELVEQRPYPFKLSVLLPVFPPSFEPLPHPHYLLDSDGIDGMV